VFLKEGKMAKEKEVVKESSVFDSLDDMIKKQFNNVIDLSKVDGKVKTWYDTGVTVLNYAMSRNLRYGIPGGRITSFSGLSGCIFDNTIIKVNRGKRTECGEYTVKELYQKMGYDEKYTGRKFDMSLPTNTFSFKKSCIGHNEIVEVIDSGEKETFMLKTESGKTIIVSEEHPFKVPDENIKGRGDPEKDDFVALKDLVVGETVMVKSSADQEVDFGSRKKNGRGINDIQYPTNTWRKETNDVLEGLAKKENNKNHSVKQNFRDFRHNDFHWEKIVSINSVGKKHTYDIRMKKPYSNFVANDFVVHNTGKSLIAATAMRDPQIDMIIVLETEGGGHAKELIEFAGVDPKKVRIVKAHTFGNYKINKKTNKIDEVADSKFPAKLESPDNHFVEGAIRQTKKIVNALQFNKKLEDAKILLILDSLGNLQSVREFSGTVDMGARAQDVGRFFRTFDTAFEKSNIGFVFTNKIYVNLGNIYDPYKETGGVNAEYNPSVSCRFTEMAAHAEVSDKEMSAEKDRRKTSLGSSLKSIRGQIIKSRFGTERRNCWFLLDFAVGPVKHSGLFTLLKDFGLVSKSGSRYSVNGWRKDNSFYKKDFIKLLMEDEEANLDIFQALLDAKEVSMKEEKKNLNVNDLTEVNNIDDEEDDEYAASEMINAMENLEEG